MYAQRFYGKVKNGKFNLNRGQVLQAYVSGQVDGNYYLEFHKSKGSPKTLEQQGYYYGVVIPHTTKALKEQGNETVVLSIGKRFKELPLIKEVVDMLLKINHATFRGIEVRSKAEFSIKDYSDLIDVSIRWVAEHLHYVIPPPDAT